ncbi:MAG: hypothetical protein DRP71_05070 [Verrucomicrobia bacterium]|nr:MAG: hypothetical protein DRP71_05070 [Verrucomicrobiota bacterium]
MNTRFTLITATALSVLASLSSHAPADPVDEAIVGDAVLNNEAYRLLDTLTTRFGARLTGTDGNTRSMDFLEAELNALNIETRRETTSIPGWTRSDDRVSLIHPHQRDLRAVAFGYVDRHDPFEAGVVFIENREIDELEPDELQGRVGLIAPGIRFSQQEFERLVHDFGLRGALLINRVNGGQILGRVANHDGITPPLPIYSVTVEEGRWIQRQLEDGLDVRVRIETRSQPVEMTIDNLVATLPGVSDQKIILGAHFDSWDFGQGAIDNGVGIAQLFDTARLLQAHSAINEHTVEFVWFNAEEWGLFGSRDYVERHDLGSVRVMINLDMAGRPIQINAMGFDELIPLLDTYSAKLGSWEFEKKTANKTWLGSDHHPFILKGVPSITFNAPFAPEDVRYYHDFGDSFEKIDREMLARATALTALLIRDLANDTTSELRHYSEKETAELFRKAGLEKKMRKAGKWPFGETEAVGED